MKQRNTVLSWILWILAFLILNSIIFVLVTATPKFEFSVQDQEGTNQVQVSILRTSFFPYSKFEVLLDDTPLHVTKVSDKVYSTLVTANGTLEIRATNFNGMQKHSFERVGTIDDTPPNVYGEFTGIGEVTLKLEDVQSGIHYEAIYAIANNSDKTILPAEIDLEKEQIVFRFEGGILEVHTFDMLGNEAISTFDDSITDSSEENDDDSDSSESGANHSQSGDSASGNAKNTSASKQSEETTKAGSNRSRTSQNQSSASTTKPQTSRSRSDSQAAHSSQASTSLEAASSSAKNKAASSSTKSSQTSTAAKSSQVTSSASANSQAATSASRTSQTATTASKASQASASTSPSSTAVSTDRISTTTQAAPSASAENSQAPSAANSEQVAGPGASVNTVTTVETTNGPGN